MVVILSLAAPRENLWYLAYGSNLSSSKFVKDRGIIPLDAAVVSVPGFTLAMDSAGVPYQEPSFANIRPIDHNSFPKQKSALGTAYLVTPEQYFHIIASEGGGIAYREIQVEVGLIEVEGKLQCQKNDCKMTARTLVTVLQRLPEPRPSERYLDLIKAGALEANFPKDYQKYIRSLPHYEPPIRGSRRVGAVLFLMIWTPIVTLMEKITKATVNLDGKGNAPSVVILLVRMVVITMWWYHDLIHAPFWGRGDGREDLDAHMLQRQEPDDMIEKIGEVV